MERDRGCGRTREGRGGTIEAGIFETKRKRERESKRVREAGREGWREKSSKERNRRRKREQVEGGRR